MNRIIVDESNSNQRLDKFLSTYFSELSRSHIAKLIEEENCLVNKKVIKSSYKLKTFNTL